jgi:hypothetical protein
MLLQQLQEALASIYDVPRGPDVADFLTTDRSLLPLAQLGMQTDEQLLVAEDSDGAGVSVALYLDPQLLERLGAADPLEALHGGNIADYWTALEGVSRFAYLTWNAAHNRAVSVHELELQAEIDKYVCSAALLRAQNPQYFPAELHRLLFERAQVDPQLAGERRGLYRRANQSAARFCQRLAQKLRTRSVDAQSAVRHELRRFYRLTNAAKLHHIACLP